MPVSVLEKRMRDEACFRQVEREVYATIEDIKHMEDIDDWIDGVLDITRKEQYIDGEWKIEYYELCIGVGGPAYWVRTDGVVVGAWSGEYFKVMCDDREFLDKLAQIEDYLDEVLQ